MEHLRTTEELAEIARTSVATVRYWRYRGIGPAGFKVGRRVLYRQEDIDRWLEERRRAPLDSRSVG